MSWSLAFQVRNGELEVLSKTTELPDLNVTLNGHEDSGAVNVSSYVGVIKK